MSAVLDFFRVDDVSEIKRKAANKALKTSLKWAIGMGVVGAVYGSMLIGASAVMLAISGILIKNNRLKNMERQCAQYPVVAGFLAVNSGVATAGFIKEFIEISGSGMLPKIAGAGAVVGALAAGAFGVFITWGAVNDYMQTIKRAKLEKDIDTLANEVFQKTPKGPQ